jgi:CheY-like chemotaxis protein
MLVTAVSPASARPVPVVLLVEDHEDTRQMYAAFLGDAFVVQQAASAQQALEVMQQTAPDLLITDVSLPGMDGFELVSRMRSMPALRDVPIICLSGYGGHGHEERGRKAGCDRMLQKPCMPDDLAREAAALLRQSPPRGRPS